MTRIEILGLAVLAILVAIAGNAFAGTHCYWIGNNQYCQGDDGFNANSYQIGKDTFWQGSDANGNTFQQHCYYIGQDRYCN